MDSKIAVTWHGHSNVSISSRGLTFLIDPFFEGNPFAPDWRTVPRPDLILVTHSHGDHLGQTLEMANEIKARVACIHDLAYWLIDQGLSPQKIINDGAGANIDGAVVEFGVRITLTSATHSSPHGAPIGFVMEFPGGPTIYHAGDTGLFSDMALIGDRFQIDLAMVPIGGVFTMDGPLAARALGLIKPKAAMPIHYATFPALAPDPSAFTQAAEKLAPACRIIAPRPGESFTI